ncbi:MAG: sensor histidine kinase [Nocardia sp.]|nr:sensor histidine kinase [Nocardia sp.]
MTLDPARVLYQLRSLTTVDHLMLDAATRYISEGERSTLANQLSRAATHLATGIGSNRAVPSSLTATGTDCDELDLCAQPTAALVAAVFVRNTLHRWQWGDVLVDAECVVRELITAAVDAVTADGPGYPTRITVRLNAIASTRLRVEIRDCPDNAAAIAAAERLTTDRVEHLSARCGRHHAHGRTTLWAELTRPGDCRWI